MEVRVKLGSIAEFKSDAVIAGLFEGTESLGGDIAAVDKALGGVVGDLISRGEIKGKLNEVTVIHSLGRLPASRVAVVGLGKREELSRDKICGVVAGACRSLRHKGTEIIAVTALGAGVAGIDGQAAAQAVTEGALLGLYTFRKYLTKENDYSEIKELNIF